MARADLLALTADDLATLANRGLLKRAQRDLEAGAGPVVTESASGTVQAEWPDGALVTLEPDAPLSDRACSCAALTLCRHVVGAVLAYQLQTPKAAASDGPWDPGALEVKAPEPPFDGVAELFRGTKPSARLEPLGVTLRFLVPHDARYVQCDCAEPSPCRHVAIAVGAFRQLPAGQTSGLVFAGEKRPRVSDELVDDAEGAVRALFFHGLAALPPTELRRWEAMPGALRRRSMPWPAEVAAEMLAAFDLYRAGDARFDPARVARLAAELLIRLRAARAATGAAPQLFIRGPANSGDATELGFARLTGLGCHVRPLRKSTVVSVPMQELSTGAVVVAKRELALSPASFAQLALTPFAKGVSLATLGEANLLIQGGKRGANAELLPARARFSGSPQSFEWEKLRAPVLMEDFAELAAHRAAQPPACLRARRLAEDVHVVPVARWEDVRADAAFRQLSATLVDHAGGCLALVMPFYSRGRAGFARLRQVLSERESVFVAGVLRAGPVLEPIGVVYRNEAGARELLQPWVTPETGAPLDDWGEGAVESDPLAAYLGELLNALGEAALVGFEQADPLAARRWRSLAEQGAGLGWTRWLEPLERMVGACERRGRSFEVDAGAVAVEAAVELALVTVFGSG